MEALAQNEPTNTMEERTISGIYLRTLHNIQGGYEILNLKTGKPITRHHITELPATKEDIARVEQLAKRDGFKPHAEPIFKTYALFAGVDNVIPHQNDYEENDSDEDSVYTQEEDDDDSYDEEIEQQELMDLQNEGALTPRVDSDDNSDNQSTCSEDEPTKIEWQDTQVPEPTRRSERVPVPRQRLENI